MVIIITGFATKEMAIRRSKWAPSTFSKNRSRRMLNHHGLRALRTWKNTRVEKLIVVLKQSPGRTALSQGTLENLNAQLRDTIGPFPFLPEHRAEREDVEKRIAIKLRNLISHCRETHRNRGLSCTRPARQARVQARTSHLGSRWIRASRTGYVLPNQDRVVIKTACNRRDCEALHISSSTVRTHRKNIRKKLKINNVQYSLRNFLSSKA